MIKNIIRQLFDLAKQLFTQLCDNDIVRIVKAWVKRLLTEDIENEVGAKEEALKETVQTPQQAQQVVTSPQAATSKKEKSETSLVEQMQEVLLVYPSYPNDCRSSFEMLIFQLFLYLRQKQLFSALLSF